MRAFLLLAVFFLLATFAFQVEAVTCPDEGDWTIVGGICVPAETGLSSQPVESILIAVMNWLLAILGFIGITAFVISGIQYLVSAGDDDTISTAKRNMKYSIIGIMVALSGYVIIQAVDAVLNASKDF
jgi:hypothetical protein